MDSTSSDDGHYQRLLERSPAGTLITTYEGQVLAANLAAADALGFDDPDELVGTDVGERYQDIEQREKLLRDLHRTGAVRHRELAMRARDGAETHLLVSVQEEDHPTYGDEVLLTTWVDVSEQHELREQLQHLATHDDLTGLLNRRALFDRTEQALAMCDRENRRAVVVYLDITGFKQVNERVGHRGGDEVLGAVGRRLKETMRETDLIARVGGDEFVVVATLVRREEDADQVGRRVLYAFEEPFEAAGATLQLHPAAGISVFPGDGAYLDTLLHRADQALWGPDRKKSPGFRRFSAAVRAEEASSWDVVEELKRALQAENELFRVYQPVVSSDGNALAGLETLVRWQHPEQGLVGPGTFIPEAEASGIIRQLDRQVFEGAVRQAGKWTNEGRSFGWIAVNLSAQTLSDPECVNWMSRVLDDHAEIAPKEVVLEITEHAAMQQVTREEVLRQLDERIGVSIAIDDFGIGYSSLLYLRYFPADYLKIDMQFVQNVVDSEPDQKVVDAVIGLARGFDLRTIAEGVETEGQEAWLREAGCHYLQGYRFGRPVPAEETEEGILT